MMCHQTVISSHLETVYTCLNCTLSVANRQGGQQQSRSRTRCALCSVQKQGSAVNARLMHGLFGSACRKPGACKARRVSPRIRANIEFVTKAFMCAKRACAYYFQNKHVRGVPRPATALVACCRGPRGEQAMGS